VLNYHHRIPVGVPACIPDFQTAIASSTADREGLALSHHDTASRDQHDFDLSTHPPQATDHPTTHHHPLTPPTPPTLLPGSINTAFPPSLQPHQPSFVALSTQPSHPRSNPITKSKSKSKPLPSSQKSYAINSRHWPLSLHSLASINYVQSTGSAHS
jgi:hypothetical protein